MNNSEKLGIQISYPKQIDNFNNNQEIEVCITARYSGQYRGALIFTPKSDTNVVVEVGTWLLVNVSGDNFMPYQEESSQTNQISQTQQKEQTQSSLTGAVIGESEMTKFSYIGLIALGLLIIVIFIYIRRKRKWEKGYYY